MVELTDVQVSIFGRPNFACARTAKVLIAAGEYKDGGKKAEYEQAVFIHWASTLLEKHGKDEWAGVASKILDRCIKKLEEPS